MRRASSNVLEYLHKLRPWVLSVRRTSFVTNIRLCRLLLSSLEGKFQRSDIAQLMLIQRMCVLHRN
jgi:hypothetical protein